MLVERNSEILFLYDARLCNPNGDPDEENRPRMDYETRRNLVSDVRLKRYLRDYWIAWKPEAWMQKSWEYPVPQDVWVRTVNGETTSAKRRINQLAADYQKARGISKPKSAEQLIKDPTEKKKFRAWLAEHLIDIRLFGATIPVKDEERGGGGLGENITLTGPVQFTWGYSLNRVDLLPSSTITSHFAGRERGEKGKYGTMGKDWRVKYSFLAFYGLVSAWRAKETGLLEKDVKLLGNSLINGLPLMATSRSKIGQTPRLFLRVEYANNATFLGDFRTRIRLGKDEGLEDIADAKMDFAPLLDWLAAHQGRVHKVVVWAQDEFASGQAFAKALQEKFGDKVTDLNALLKNLTSFS